MSRQEIDEFLREFDQDLLGAGFFPNVSSYMDRLMGALNGGFSGDKALHGKTESNEAKGTDLARATPERFGNIMDMMRESITRSQEVFKHVWDHFEDLRKNGFPNDDGKSQYYMKEMRHVSLPGGVHETKTFERDNAGERSSHIREMDGRKVTENYTKDFASGKEDRSRQLDGVTENDVDAFY